MAEKVFRYKAAQNSVNSAELLEITPAEIMAMSTQEFLLFKQRLVNVRHRTRYDTVIYEKLASITPLMKKTIFRKGIGQKENYATSDTEYVKTRFHTNMTRNGEFEAGSLVIIYDIAAPVTFHSGAPTTVAFGAVTNAKVTAFSAYNDPTLTLNAWQNQTEIIYREGDSEDGIVRDLLKAFPANNGQAGYLGASVGGVAQNALVPNLPLPNPRSLEGGEDFSVEVVPLANFDTSNATGIDTIIVQKVELQTVELITLKT